MHYNTLAVFLFLNVWKTLETVNYTNNKRSQLQVIKEKKNMNVKVCKINYLIAQRVKPWMSFLNNWLKNLLLVKAELFTYSLVKEKHASQECLRKTRAEVVAYNDEQLSRVIYLERKRGSALPSWPHSAVHFLINSFRNKNILSKLFFLNFVFSLIKNRPN